MTTHRLTAPEARLRASRRGQGLVAAVLALGAAAGCDLPANPRRAQLLTFADLERLADPMDPEATFANDDGVPGGLRVRDYVTKDDAGYHLTLRNTWTEGYRSAYETAELWTGFDEVWVQPVYVPVTGFADGKPVLLPDPSNPEPDKAWSPIFSVGPDSAFYSPFWQVFYFQVPPTTDPEAFKTTREVIDSGLPLIPGPGHTMSIVPGDDVLPATTVAPYQSIGGPAGVSAGYLDGQEVRFLDFGESNFSWNDDLVVDATPLFMLVYRDDAGNLQRLNVPTVAGTGPLYANRRADVTDTIPPVPHYGAFWRLYTVEVPSTARIFAPADLYPTEAADYAQPLVATTYGANVSAAGVLGTNQWLGRVALNALPAADMSDKGCFNDVNNLDVLGGGMLDEPCQWLDSQPAIEQRLPPSAITPTDILVTCPFVSYQDTAVVVTP